MEKLTLEVTDDAIAVLTLRDESTLNALSTQMLAEMSSALDHLMTMSTRPRVLIITGMGKSFVAGASIAEMARFNPVEAMNFAQLGHGVMDKLEALPIPTIAAVNGFALGGGCELALACDVVIASERAKFGQPEVGLGIIPGFGGTQRLARRIGLQNARQMIFTGDHIKADKALALGLALEVVAPESLMNRCLEIAAKYVTRSPTALAQAKRAINRGVDADLATGLAVERHAFALLFGTHDQKEGMAAFLEKRSAKFSEGDR